MRKIIVNSTPLIALAKANKQCLWFSNGAELSFLFNAVEEENSNADERAGDS